MPDNSAHMVASALAGAISGGLVSWLAAPYTMNQQERGRRHIEARETVRAIVWPLLTQVRQYQNYALSSLGREAGDNAIHGSDVQLCGQILSAAGRLSWWRRRRVIGAAKRLFGKATVELCGINGESAGEPDVVMGMLLNRQINAIKHPERFQPPDRGQFDDALRHDPDSWRVERLKQQLMRLADCR